MGRGQGMRGGWRAGLGTQALEELPLFFRKQLLTWNWNTRQRRSALAEVDLGGRGHFYLPTFSSTPPQGSLCKTGCRQTGLIPYPSGEVGQGTPPVLSFLLSEITEP